MQIQGQLWGRGKQTRRKLKELGVERGTTRPGTVRPQLVEGVGKQHFLNGTRRRDLSLGLSGKGQAGVKDGRPPPPLLWPGIPWRTSPSGQGLAGEDANPRSVISRALAAALTNGNTPWCPTCRLVRTPSVDETGLRRHLVATNWINSSNAAGARAAPPLEAEPGGNQGWVMGWDGLKQVASTVSSRLPEDESTSSRRYFHLRDGSFNPTKESRSL